MTTPTITHLEQSRSWPKAYKAFLLDPKQSLVLKFAPLAILAGSPEIIISNIIPVVGEILDIGGVTLSVLVAAKTYHAVKKYR